VYLELEEPRHDLEFLWTSMEYDERGNVLKYNMEPVHPIEVTKDRGDHLNMSSKEIKEYKELLW